MSRFCLYLISVLTIISCINHRKSIEGKYVRSAKGLNNVNVIFLDSNHTFKFDGLTCTSGYGTKGTWVTNRNKLILNTFPFVRNKDSMSILVQSKKVLNDDSITIEIIDDSLETLIGVEVIAFYKKIQNYAVSDLDGIVKLKYENYDSIVLSYTGYSRFILKPSIEKNYFKIKLKEDNNSNFKSYQESLRFENEKWKIGKHKLIDPRFKKHKRDNIYHLRKLKSTSDSYSKLLLQE